MEICVNEYVRTEYGEIEKVVCIYDKRYMNEEGNITRFNEIKSHSKNLIDLIEDEDIVILEYYVSKYRKRIQRKFEPSNLLNKKIYFDNRHCSFGYNLENKKWIDGKGFNPKIKSIVTHEQFSNIEYKVEE